MPVTKEDEPHTMSNLKENEPHTMNNLKEDEPHTMSNLKVIVTSVTIATNCDGGLSNLEPTHQHSLIPGTNSYTHPGNFYDKCKFNGIQFFMPTGCTDSSLIAIHQNQEVWRVSSLFPPSGGEGQESLVCKTTYFSVTISSQVSRYKN